MKTLYRLMLERWSRDLALSTAAGVTAGMAAALGDETKPLESRVDAELANIFEQLERKSLVIEGGPNGPALPIKRGPGRPRKNPEAEGTSDV